MGSGDRFEQLLALYRNDGFKNGPVFGDYRVSGFSQFLRRKL
jgi:hypothetical protein